jgi:hypothetical protein
MSNHSKTAPIGEIVGQKIYLSQDAGTPGNERLGESKRILTAGRGTPGSAGLNDHGEQVCWAPGAAGGSQSSETAPQLTTDDAVSELKKLEMGKVMRYIFSM